ncbi:MAG TPA: trimeric intracellular cation channel family protein [Methanocorpusculum sp.]|nr:trimeric intracellular cation channel family protein [Methanocorpusculum sp.]
MMEQYWLIFIRVLQDLGTALRIPVSFVVIEFIGTFAFALSGIRLASAKRFDVFGAWIVGMATAIGGGTIRDLLLGLQPFWMTNSIYFICCAIAVFWVMLFRRYLIHQTNAWFIFDTIGLALFNVIGIEKTLNMGLPAWMAITMGSVTGAAGGIIRDVLINEVPLIFRKEIYAVACVAGGVVYVSLAHFTVTPEICALLSSVTVIVTRVLAVKYHWHLPVLKGEDGDM